MTRALVALLVAGGAALLFAGDGDLGRLRRDVQSALEKRDYPRAASVGEDLAAREPASPGPAYNVACAYSRLGQTEKTLRWLQAAAQRGFSFTATALRDTDLDPLRREPGFAEVIAAFERNGAAALAEYAILRAVARARAAHGIDPARIVLTGFSQGGPMAFYVALRQPGLFAGVIPVAGFYEEWLNPLPASLPAAFPRFFIMNGARDEAAPNNRQVARSLEALGAAVELRVYTGVATRSRRTPTRSCATRSGSCSAGRDYRKLRVRTTSRLSCRRGRPGGGCPAASVRSAWPAISSSGGWRAF